MQLIKLNEPTSNIFDTIFFILTASLGLTARSHQTADNSSTEISFSKLDIPKHWTEIKKQDSEWIYSIPCHNFRELQTVDISNADNIPRVSCNFGTDGQLFTIQNIRQQVDSLVFTTVLPYDSSSTVLMSMKYLDKEKILLAGQLTV